MKKIPFHITNNSKSQLSIDFLGNTQAPLYQQGAEYIQNAIVVPEGSVKKRAGTRLIALALQGDKARLRVVDGRVIVFGSGFFTMIEGLDVMTANRQNLSAFDNNTIKQAFPSDVFVDYSNHAPLFYAGSSTPYPADNSPDTKYFVDRDGLPRDTYLHKGPSVLTGFDVKPDQDVSATFPDKPDAAAAADFTNIKYFPDSNGAFVPANGAAKPVLKIPYENNVDISKGAVMFTKLAVVVAGSQKIMTFSFGNRASPEFHDSEMVKDFRILKFKELGSKPYIQTVDGMVKEVDYAGQNSYINATINAVFGSTSFQNRFVFAARTDKTKLFFSAGGNPLEFDMNPSPNDNDAFVISIDAIGNTVVTLLHEFGNVLVIGTIDAIYVLQNGTGNVSVTATVPLSLTKISDVGVSDATPVLHDSKLYLVTNDGQGMMELKKNPYGESVAASRIMTFSDSPRTNGYIKRLFYWQWDYQYLGLLMSDGIVVKANMDASSVNFNQWVFDKDTILDVDVLTVKGQEDVIYFTVEREGVTYVEAMFHNQDIQKNEHSYSCIRNRLIEEENVNQYRKTVLPRYARNGTFNDCALTLKIRVKPNVTYTVNGSVLVVSGQDNALERYDLIAGEFYVLGQNSPTEYLVDNPKGTVVSTSGLSSGLIERRIWRNMYLREGMSANVDGKAFLENPKIKNGVMELESYGQVVTVGCKYRFVLVSTDIVTSYGVEGVRKPRVLNPVSVMFNFTPLVEVGRELGRLDEHKVEYRRWMQFSVFNGEELECKFVVKLDAPSPIEVVSIAGEYGV